jgi:hypothetical protein
MLLVHRLRMNQHECRLIQTGLTAASIWADNEDRDAEHSGSVDEIDGST